jgi:opacity protein-like surface antigen
LFGVGFGYDTGHYFRFDITGEYRGNALFFANAKYAGSDGSFSHLTGAATDEYTADIESWVGLANMYIDLGTWHCVTPYIGGGVGLASIDVIGLKDVNVPNGGVAFAKDNTQCRSFL